MSGILSYPETRPPSFSLDLSCDMFIEFLFEGALELLACLLDAL
jgi:hypothetical protein